MLRFLVSQLRHSPARATALAGAVVVAAVAFVLLSSAAKTTDLRVKGSVRSNFRTAYDILVRPPGSTTGLERRAGLVRPNYLSGIFGGITMKQYRRIKKIHGVEVAAPIANVGFVLPFASTGINLTKLLNLDPFQLYRIRATWVADDGTSRYPGGSPYVYFTRRDRWIRSVGFRPGGELIRGSNELVDPCLGFAESRPSAYGPFGGDQLSYMSCYSARSPQTGVDQWPQSNGVLPEGAIGTAVSGYFPIFVAAIDPVQEARLVHLDRTIVRGRYLRESDAPKVVFTKPKLRPGEPASFGRPTGKRYLPTIVSARAYVGETLRLTIERLRLPKGVDVPRTLAQGRSYDFVMRLPGHQLERRSIPLSALYAMLLEGRRASKYAQALPDQIESDSYWTTSPTRYRVRGLDRVAPIVTRNPIAVWKNSLYPYNGGFKTAPPSNRDVQFRRLHAHAGSNLFDRSSIIYRTPLFKIVGRFDPRKLPSFSPLSGVPLETYYPPLVEPGDATAARLLHSKPLLPTQNLGGYIQQPPLLLTTLAALRTLLNPVYFSHVKGKAEAPISVIRVKVAGVTGPDTLSEARISRVAVAIHDATGLDVDITAGSSPHPLLVELPRGKFGRPALTVREGWSKKGVSVSFLRALDRKRLALFTLILVTCSFFVANNAFAVTRARRREIGTLLCLGWSERAIFRALIGELAVVGLVAGVVGIALAAVLTALLSLDLPIARAFLVTPLALALTLVAGFVPAQRAARSVPLDAVRPPVAAVTRRRPVRGIPSLALVNVRRARGRSLLAIAGLLVGVAGLTLLVAINRAFQGSLVGTLLGQAISLQVRGLDFVAVGVTIGLAARSVADVLFTNLRERAAEVVTLRTVGWRDSDLAETVALEAIALGLAGGIAGAALGLILGFELGVPVASLAIGASLAALGGIGVALIASLVPLSQIRRLTPPAVLAAE